MCFHKSFHRCQAWVQGGTTPIKSAPSGTARVEESRREVKGGEWVLSCLKDDILCAHFVTQKNIHFLNQKYYLLKIFTNNHPHQSLLWTLHGAQTCPKRYTDALKLHLLLECTSIFPLHFTFPPMKKQNKKTVIWGKTPNLKERVEHANHVSGDKNLHWNISLGSTSNLHFLQIHIVHTL